ncbi:SpoIIE family protein phosphatase [Oscillatoria sp. FACHB-1406]|uniref:PP2C family protein-serine/threonine phosphatase n=1 Tax=Oscillatoria sp. FACHB-1406 TaxID=2692846 RepID=UPI0016854BA4|nr:SpoIIE family protein phosphatase [Oscillatoria sp. FACHB-1406]MBD2577320.1 SpoIIE family protein phosphatase [Oscillatoria sp. FACHB-1406]
MAQILVIDDDPAIQVLLKRALAKKGYEVEIASDGEEGLAKAKAMRPALVICDWVMPRLSGIEVCRAVKATPELSTTIFILLTSMGSVESRVKGLDAGADDFVCKPVEMFELNARVRSGLRQHELSRDLQQQKHRLEAELLEAAEYVRSILPEPLLEPPVRIDVRFVPCSRLGGDSFDYFWLDEEHLAIYLLDVSGHGLRSALPSLSVINLLRSQSLVQVDYRQPSDVLRNLNDAFQMTQRNDKYFTIWYGVYNQKTRQLIYASGGHPPAVLISPAGGGLQVELLKTPGFPAGMFPGVEYVEQSCEISPASSLYIFSDGIYEINQTDGEIWGYDNFVDRLKNYQAKLQRNLDFLIEEVKEVNPRDSFDDDLSIVQIDFE